MFYERSGPQIPSTLTSTEKASKFGKDDFTKTFDHMNGELVLNFVTLHCNILAPMD